MKDRKIKAFYFAREDERLGYGDGRAVSEGVVHEVDCMPECCIKGLHASSRIIDALEYSDSPICYLVELGGEIHFSDDKMAATERKYIKRLDLCII